MLRVFDPRRGEDFRLHLGDRQFSSLAAGLLVVASEFETKLGGLYSRIPPTIDLGEHRDLIGRAIHGTSRLAFICCSLSSAIERQLGRLTTYREFGSSAFAYLDLKSDDLDLAFATKRTLGAGDEWLVGGAIEELEAPAPGGNRGARCSLAHLLRQVEAIGCIFRQEGHDVVIATRLFPGVDEVGDLGRAR